jgi:hypothetical protein
MFSDSRAVSGSKRTDSHTSRESIPFVQRAGYVTFREFPLDELIGDGS